MDGQTDRHSIHTRPPHDWIRVYHDQPTLPPQPTTTQAHTLRSLAAATTTGIGSGSGLVSTRLPPPPIIPTPFGGLGLLGAVRAFSVGFGGLQYDTLVEMQEK